MKNKYVYEILDPFGNVVDVGESINPHTRWRAKTQFKSTAKFSKDHTYRIVSDALTKEEALRLEGEHKLKYGIEWTKRTAHMYADHKQMVKTQQERGTGWHGKNLLKRKLTKKQVEEIRSKYIPHKYTTKTLSKEYNVSESFIKNVIHNKERYKA